MRNVVRVYRRRQEARLDVGSQLTTGIGQELVTIGDDYMLQISLNMPADRLVKQLVIAAVMCIEMVLKE